MGFQFIYPLSWNDAPFLMHGALITLKITCFSILFGTILGFFVGIAKYTKGRFLPIIATVYIEPFRNTPVLAQLFLIAFGIPMMFPYIQIEAETAAIIGLSLNTAAFVAVIVHSSILSVNPGQWEAAKALGHTPISTFRYVIFKQAVRIFIPPAISLYVTQFQVSSVVALINIMELTQAGKSLNSKTHEPFKVWAVVMLIYFIISFPLSKYAKYLERKLAKT